MVGRRVVVTGLAGSGKSTFALALAARTDLPVIHLDLSYWKPGWVAPSETEWREKQRALLAGDAWIADGNYRETLDLRLERADTVVVLDMPWWRCSGRALLRGFRMPAELPDGCDYPRWMRLRDEWRLAVRIWRQRRSEPQRERQIIAEHGQPAARYVLRDKREVTDFLEGLEADAASSDDLSGRRVTRPYRRDRAASQRPFLVRLGDSLSWAPHVWPRRPGSRRRTLLTTARCGRREFQMDGQPNQVSWFYGRRRQVPMFAAFAVLSGVIAITAQTIAGAAFELGLAVWCAATAVNYWRHPVIPRDEVDRTRRRARRLGSHPVRGAVTGALVIATAVSVPFWRTGLVSLVMGGVVGGLIGIGLYFVFRTDPSFHRGDGGPFDRTGRRRISPPRWIRWWLGAPNEVESFSLGPPDLGLDRRTQLLVTLRTKIAERGFTLDEVRRTRRVLARDDDAVHGVERDEEQADQRDQWWTAQIVWRSPEGPSVLVYSADPVGQELRFTAWGPAASTCLDTVESLLRSEGRA